MKKFDFDFEEFFSKLLRYQSYMEGVATYDKTGATGDSKLNNSVEKIKEVIRLDTTYDFCNQDMKHIGFFKGMSNLVKSGNKLNVVTTNYDTLIEDAANSDNYTVFDGFSFSAEPIFDVNMFDWNLVKDIKNVSSREKIYKQTY